MTDELPPLDRERALCLLGPAQPLEQALREVIAQAELELSVRRNAGSTGMAPRRSGPDNGRVAERAASATSSRARDDVLATAVSRTWRVSRSTGCPPSSVSNLLIPRTA